MKKSTLSTWICGNLFVFGKSPMMVQLPAQQNKLFYEFCWEKHIPEDHFLRQMDQFPDFESIRQHLHDYAAILAGHR